MYDDEDSEENESPKDVKLGEFQLKETEVLVIKKTNYNGQDRIDFRVWVNSSSYKGPTKKGFVLSMEKMDEFIKLVDGMKEKLGIVEKAPEVAQEKPAKKSRKKKDD